MTDLNLDLGPILQQIANSDKAAFKRLYDLTSAKLLGVILRIIKDRIAAEDVLQDVYLRIWRNAARYSPEAGSANGWVVTIARNRAIDLVRRKSEQTMPENEDGEDWFAKLAEGRDREGEIMDASSLRYCLGQMDAEKRACVLDAYYEGLSREELAERYRQPVNTIKTWLHRAIAALRACMETNG